MPISNKLPIALCTTLAICLSAGDSMSLPPATGALTDRASNHAALPKPRAKPLLVIGQKTKLFMTNDAYLFGTQAPNSSSAARQQTHYRVGMGKEFERKSGSTVLGEVSFRQEGKSAENNSRAAANTRLSAAYLRQLNKKTDIRAGLSADLGAINNWSTVELQLSLKLSEQLSLKLKHDNGRAINGPEREHSTGFFVERNF